MEHVTSWHSYPSIYALGHKAIAELLTVPVNVEEKVDGSQFSFGIFDGEIRCRSKGAVLHVDAPEKMFGPAVESAKKLAPDLVNGWTYRAEYLSKPNHNALAYDRAPRGNLILFDVNTGHEEYLHYHTKVAVAHILGLDVVPLLFSGKLDDIAAMRQFLDTTSVLGGQKVEGVVVKPALYSLYGADKKVLMGKFVSEAFKEVHGNSWREANPTRGDMIETLKAKYRTPARWGKALQHLTEAGAIEGSPKDIGALIREVPLDVRKECEGEIKEALFAWAWPHIARASGAGLAEWYKEVLLKRQFEQVTEGGARAR